jgi:putative ferrous iron transport protein C
MMADLKAYLSSHGRAPMAELVNHLHADPDAIRGMLDLYIRKGRVKRLESELGDCGGCAKCDAFQLEIYEWLD